MALRKHRPVSPQTVNRREFLQIAGATASTALVSRPSLNPAVSGMGETRWRGQPIYLTDLDRCRPKSALAPKRTKRCWKMMPYSTESLTGTMLVAGEETEAAEVTYPLSVRGWHAIYLGMYSERQQARVMVRLSGDPAFSTAMREQASYFMSRIEDVFWKCANLTGQEIIFRQDCSPIVPAGQQYGNSCAKAFIAYIKLVPLSEEEVRALQFDRSRSDTRRLFAHDDAWSFHYWFRPTTEADIRRQIEPYRHTDFVRLYWEAAQGDRCNYFTRIGRYPSDESIMDFPRSGDRLAAESFRQLREKGIDPLRVAAAAAREIGLEFHAAFRTEAFVFAPPGEEWATGGFYDKHPELRCMGRDGSQAPRISYAFPETQEFVISILKEMAEYPVEGICLLYNRRPPMVMYEKPLIEGFQKEFGEDPRTLDERDPRWLRYRCSALTEFMRKVRKEMDASGKRQGRPKRLVLSAWVMPTEEENLFYGLDLQTWIREELIDTLIPYGSVRHQYGPWNPRDVEFFAILTKGTGCQLAMNIMPRVLPPEDFRRRAHALYQVGVQYLAFWDCNMRYNLSPSWHALCELGHSKEIEAWVRAGEPSLEPASMELHRLGGIDMRYARPG